jgi:hypothetical protein
MIPDYLTRSLMFVPAHNRRLMDSATRLLPMFYYLTSKIRYNRRQTNRLREILF